ncbi:SPARC-like protein 1, partial [Eschrichtius robustus]|nr:SPARC-like protein 1 [Eschrichtius robustus]
PEKSSLLKSEEENHDPSADQDQSYSQNLGLQDQEKSESDLTVNLEYTPTEGTLDLKEDMSEPPKEKLPERFLGHDVSSIVDSNQQESITETEENQEQPINDSHPQLNRSSKHSQDLSVQGNQEQDPNIPNGEEEGEKEPGKVGTHNDNQEREREVPKEHSNSKQEEDSTQSDDILEESYQPTQVSTMQKDEFEQGGQEQEEENTNAEMEEDTASKISKPNQDKEWQSQEGKPGLEVVSNHEEMDKKTLSEPLLVEPTDDGNITPRNHGADDDGDDGPRHNASEEYSIPSEAFLENERAQPSRHHIKYEEQREEAHENENVDTSEPVENRGAEEAESSPNEDDSSTEGNTRVHGVGKETIYSYIHRVLTHSELAPLRASLVPLEHCITRFFEECDPNKDKHITLEEWGHCFEIKEEDIDENLLF